MTKVNLNNGTFRNFKMLVELLVLIIVLVLWFTTIKFGVASNCKDITTNKEHIRLNDGKMDILTEDFYIVKGDVREISVKQDIVMQNQRTMHDGIEDIKKEIKK